MFRFTNRDVLLTMAIVGLSVGWWLDHRKTRIDWERIKTTEAQLREDRHWMEVRFKRERARYVYTLRAAADRGLTPADISYEHP
jgi:hypothetical protein